MTPDGWVDATFFAQVQPTFSRWTDNSGEKVVTSAKVERLTQSKPAQPLGGTVTVKLTIRVPKSAFLPLRPEAVVVVPESMTDANPVVVIAEDPS